MKYETSTFELSFEIHFALKTRLVARRKRNFKKNILIREYNLTINNNQKLFISVKAENNKNKTLS